VSSPLEPVPGAAQPKLKVRKILDTSTPRLPTLVMHGRSGSTVHSGHRHLYRLYVGGLPPFLFVVTAMKIAVVRR